MESQNIVAFTQPIRPLHWVIKVSDLKQALNLLTSLGARVLRHEEFESGCEASCNGPYSGYWSKSMVGWSNEDESFVFELTFNYGVTSYKRGNDLACLVMHKFNSAGEDMEAVVNKLHPDASKSADGVFKLINDDFVLKFEDSKAEAGAQLVKGLELNVTDKEASLAFYEKVGMTKSDNGALTCKNFPYFTMKLNWVEAIDRGEAYGRLAFSCADADV